MLITLYVVFTYVMKLSIPHYQLFLLIGIITWNYFSEATSNSLNSLSVNSNILKKHKIEPYVFIISSCLSSLISLFLSFFIFFLMLLVFNVKVEIIGIMGLLYIIFLFFMTLGISLVIAGIYSYFKDIRHLWSFSLLIGFWLSPIIYSEMVLPDYIRKFYMLNPLARVISHLRNLYIYDYIGGFDQIFITFLLCVSILFFGLWLFNKLSKNIVERI